MIYSPILGSSVFSSGLQFIGRILKRDLQNAIKKRRKRRCSLRLFMLYDLVRFIYVWLLHRVSMSRLKCRVKKNFDLIKISCKVSRASTRDTSSNELCLLTFTVIEKNFLTTVTKTTTILSCFLISERHRRKFVIKNLALERWRERVSNSTVSKPA